MGQPVKKKIQEAHSDLIKEDDIYTLLVDGNSLLFMCFKDNKINSEGVHYGAVFQFLLQLRMLLSKKDYDYVYVFFDDEYSGLLRWRIYEHYKANRDKHYANYGESDYMKAYNAKLKDWESKIFKKPQKEESEESLIDENFDRERDILCRYFNELFIRWNIDEVTEGDDQIAYYCKNKKENEKIIIVSGDMDLCQLLDEYVAIYDLKTKKYITNKTFKDVYGFMPSNILVKKVFTGDKSDNISNITGLSEEKFFELMPEIKTKTVTIDEVKERAREKIEERKKNKKKPLKLHENIINGVSNKKYNGDFYEINKKIIDLGNPLLSEEAREELDAMRYAPMDPEGRSFQNLYKMIMEDNIEELLSTTKFSGFFNIFKRLEQKERKRFEEYEKTK